MDVSSRSPRKDGVYRLRHQVELDKDLGMRGGSFHETPVGVGVRVPR